MVSLRKIPASAGMTIKSAFSGMTIKSAFSGMTIKSAFYVCTLFILFLILLSGCLSLRTDYQEITYYRLNQVPGTFQNIGSGSIKGTLQLRNFTAGEEIETDRLLALWDDNNVQRYNYHRWAADCADLVTDFLVNRLNTIGVFTGGTVKSSTIIVPDYIMEGHILDMIAHNSKSEEAGSNYVFLSIRIGLLKRTPVQEEQKVIFNKVFSSKIPRKSSIVETIPSAYSKALSQITDKMLIDIQEAIGKDRMDGNE